MAKRLTTNFDTMDIKAKKKKNFLIVGIILTLVVIFLIAIVGAVLSVDDTKLYESRAHDQTEKLEVIQAPEFKENWAIAINNRMRDQEKRMQGLIQEHSNKQLKFLDSVKSVLEQNQKQNEANIKNLAETLNAKVSTMRQEIYNQFKVQDEKLKQIEIIAKKNLPNVNGANTDLVIGTNFLPKRPAGSGVGDGSVTIIVPFRTYGGSKPQLIIDQNGSIVSNTTGTTPERFIAAEGNITTAKGQKIEQKAAKEDDNLTVDLPLLVPDTSKRKEIKLVQIDNSFNEGIIAAHQEIQDEESANEQEEEKNKNNFHLSTGLSQAYMITGAYAPAFSEGESDPLPVLFEAEGQIIQPNDHLGSADKCFLIGSAKGNMNSQTAEIKLVKLSCLFQSGTYRLEADIKGWIIGENGMPGVSGELLHKNGAWLARTFIAGFLETFSEAFASNNTTTINFGGPANTASSVSENAKSAAAGGLSNVFSKLGEYYLKMAEQIFPVIEVRGGRTVDLFLVGGENFTVVENQMMDVDAIDSFLGARAYEGSVEKTQKTTSGGSTNPFTRSVMKIENVAKLGAKNDKQ